MKITNDILDKLGYNRTPKGLPNTIEELEEFRIEAVRKAKEEVFEDIEKSMNYNLKIEKNCHLTNLDLFCIKQDHLSGVKKMKELLFDEVRRE